MRFILSLLYAAGLTAGTFSTQEQPAFIGIGFGEIPILSESFKPAVTLGHRIGRDWEFAAIFQTTDRLRRDGASYNAQNSGLEGLQRSSERTGPRIMAAAIYMPPWSVIQGFVGMLYCGEDEEQIRFAGPLDVTVTRPAGIAPVLGLGYVYQTATPWSLFVNFAINPFGTVPDPDVDVGSDLSAQDASAVTASVKSGYRDNFHNRYHQFNVGLSYRF